MNFAGLSPEFGNNTYTVSFVTVYFSSDEGRKDSTFGTVFQVATKKQVRKQQSAG